MVFSGKVFFDTVYAFTATLQACRCCCVGGLSQVVGPPILPGGSLNLSVNVVTTTTTTTTIITTSTKTTLVGFKACF